MPELNDPRRVRVLVSGGVQGVGFRWFCRQEAMGRGLTGFVRNLPDGRVEAVFEGAPRGVEEMIGWCRTGPGGARVASVEVLDEVPSGVEGFVIGR